MFTKIICGTLLGIKGLLVEVEVDVSDGFPNFGLVGMAGSTIKEAKERVRTGIKNAGYNFPFKRIVVNLAPAHIPKHGVGFDLPIALGILACEGAFNKEELDACMVIGELALDGTIRPVKGILSLVDEAKSAGIKTCIIPKDNLEEGSLVEGMDIVGVSSLRETLALINSKFRNKCPEKDGSIIEHDWSESELSDKRTLVEEGQRLDFAQVKGQAKAKRGMEIAVSGRHHLLLSGPPGIGKTMLAKRVSTIMPHLKRDEQIELTKIYSAGENLLDSQVLLKNRPFRNPHHSITKASFIGGSSSGKPGEISLAHHGVLLLDEFPEFKREVIESLREPLEAGYVLLSRNQHVFRFPSKFMLVAAMNPCPCGYYPDQRRCTCLPVEIKKYQTKLSGPIFDRLDLYIEMNSVDYKDISEAGNEETSEEILKRVKLVHDIQRKRYKGRGISFNSELRASMVGEFCLCDGEAQKLLKLTYEKLNLSSRSYHRLLKVARTIADMDGASLIQGKHLAEAVSLRFVEK